MHKKINLLFCVLLSGIIGLAGISWAQGLKERMRSRLPVIADLKERQIVGEDNKGFLQMMKGQTEKQNVVREENRDRQEVYQTIAERQGVSPELVGKRRAIQIEKMAKPGTWVQDPSGEWRLK